MAHEQKPSAGPRGYRMHKRATDIAATRQGIVEAAVALHGSVGPAATTISAIAEEAGVTRLTVYRHFPDSEALFAACSAHWASGQTLPDVGAWRRVSDPEGRLRTGLADLYRFYAEGEPMLTRVRRDRDVLPAAIRDRTAATEALQRDVLLAAFTVRGARRRRLSAVLGHAISFWTWRSLCVDHGLSQGEAVEAMTVLALATAR
ncbi:MAG TPA: helix-turn-helix domain-containing protein [Actinomycetes bacterium]